jgi:hypothetical protein
VLKTGSKSSRYQQWFCPLTHQTSISSKAVAVHEKAATGLSFQPTYQTFKDNILHFFEHLDDYEYELKDY